MKALAPPELSPDDERALAEAGLVADPARLGRWIDTRGQEESLTTAQALARAAKDRAPRTADPMLRALIDATDPVATEDLDAHFTRCFDAPLAVVEGPLALALARAGLVDLATDARILAARPRPQDTIAVFRAYQRVRGWLMMRVRHCDERIGGPVGRRAECLRRAALAMLDHWGDPRGAEASAAPWLAEADHACSPVGQLALFDGLPGRRDAVRRCG